MDLFEGQTVNIEDGPADRRPRRRMEKRLMDVVKESMKLVSETKADERGRR